jgi:hypothetical protein
MLARVIFIYQLLILFEIKGNLSGGTRSSLQAFLIPLIGCVILDYLRVLRPECISEQFR